MPFLRSAGTVVPAERGCGDASFEILRLGHVEREARDFRVFAESEVADAAQGGREHDIARQLHIIGKGVFADDFEPLVEPQALQGAAGPKRHFANLLKRRREGDALQRVHFIKSVIPNLRDTCGDGVGAGQVVFRRAGTPVYGFRISDQFFAVDGEKDAADGFEPAVGRVHLNLAQVRAVIEHPLADMPDFGAEGDARQVAVVGQGKIAQRDERLQFPVRSGDILLRRRGCEGKIFQELPPER